MWYPFVGGLCSFEGPLRRGLDKFPVAIARGKHLFPFRTEQLSPVAPMVLGLQGPGRVGRRRSFNKRAAPSGRLFVVLWRFPRRLRTERLVAAIVGHAGAGASHARRASRCYVQPAAVRRRRPVRRPIDALRSPSAERSAFGCEPRVPRARAGRRLRRSAPAVVPRPRGSGGRGGWTSAGSPATCEEGNGAPYAGSSCALAALLQLSLATVSLSPDP